MSNFQPQPAWISASTAETEMRVRAFIRSVYAWMFGGLLLTAFASLWVVSSKAMQDLIWGNRFMLIVLIVAEFGLVIAISAGIKRFSPAAAASMFLVYSLLNGLTLSAVFFVYTGASIMQAFVVAGGMFGAMSVYGLVTKRDLTSWGSFFMMGLFGVFILMIAGFFIQTTALQMTIATLGIFVFLGLTAYDNQKLKRFATAPNSDNLAVFGALMLYLDFINLFLFVLRLLGDRRR